jgi:hypothetical protein
MTGKGTARGRKRKYCKQYLTDHVTQPGEGGGVRYKEPSECVENKRLHSIIKLGTVPVGTNRQLTLW